MTALPVTVISGFRGVGKTTLLNHILKNRPDLKFAVIVNSSGSLESTDGDHVQVSDNARSSVDLSGGCICCSIREDLLHEVARMATEGSSGYLLIESAAVSEPVPVADTFSYVNDDGRSLTELAQLDTLVTVVDASTFLEDFLSTDELQDRDPAAAEDGDLSQLLTEQVEFANVIVINKVDLVTGEQRGFLRCLLQQMNPDAVILEAEQGRIAVDKVLNTAKFQSEWAAQAGDWRVTDSAESENEAAAEFGISTMAYSSRRPFHPERFYDFWMSSSLTVGILRSRGCFWLATRCEIAGIWSQAGSVINAQPGGHWWAVAPEDEMPHDDPALMAEIRSVWEEPWGDRRQDLVIIGQDLDSQEITDALDKCLLSEKEMQGGQEAWLSLPDPFSSWDDNEEDDVPHDHDGNAHDSRLN